jgi:hypothetical protein
VEAVLGKQGSPENKGLSRFLSFDELRISLLLASQVLVPAQSLIDFLMDI